MIDIKPIDQFADVSSLRAMCIRLWELLDNISTFDDACREDDAAFRKLVYGESEKRNDVMLSDGYGLFVPTRTPNDESA